MTGRAFAIAAVAGALSVGAAVAFVGRRRRSGQLGDADLAEMDGGKETLSHMPPNWWRQPPPRGDTACYLRKTDALNKFREYNQAVIDDYGGMTAGGSGGEFDAMTKYGALPRNIAQALWLSLPPERANRGRGPFCLDQIDVAALNDTSPGRDHPVGFRIPDFVTETDVSRKEEEWHRSRRSPQHEPFCLIPEDERGERWHREPFDSRAPVRIPPQRRPERLPSRRAVPF